MKVTFLRHTESEFNKNNIFQGQYDCECSKEGMEKLKEFAKEFDSNYDICYCSPLKRAKITAKAVAPNMDIIYDSRLIERGLGEWENTPRTKEKIRLSRSEELLSKGAETRQVVDERVREFLHMIKDSYSKDTKVLVVTHGGIIRAMGRVLDISDNIVEIDNLYTITVKLEEFNI